MCDKMIHLLCAVSSLCISKSTNSNTMCTPLTVAAKMLSWFKLVSKEEAGDFVFVLGVCCSDSCCGRQTGASLKLNDDGGVFSVVPNLVHKALVYVSNLVYLLNNDSDSGALVHHCRFFIVLVS